MTERPYSKIRRGLEQALAFARGDETVARLHHFETTPERHNAVIDRALQIPGVKQALRRRSNPEETS